MKLKIILSALFPFISFAQMGVTCYDVGQGNCTLVLHNNYALKVPPLLIDAGSTAFKKFRSANFRSTQITAISTAISDYLIKIGRKEIFVVVSHADIDHYKWLPKIIAACIIKDPGAYVSKIFLGSARNLYIHKEFGPFLDECDPVPQFVTLNNATTVRTPIYSNGPVGTVSYTILPALQGTNEDEKNRSSLVVLVQDGPFKMAIMGDAEKGTTDHILQHDEIADKGWIVHAAHHGADTEGSNHATWLAALVTYGVVFSSGVNPTFKHPNGTIVKRISDLATVEEEGDYSPLYFGIDNAQVRCYAKGSLNYGLTAVRKPIMGTLTQGTLEYNYDVANEKIDISSKNQISSPLEKVCVLNVLLLFPRGLLEQDHLTEIDISGLHIKDNDEPDSDKELLGKLFAALINKAALLKKLSMAHNAISSDASIKNIIALIQRRLNLETVNLTHNGIAPERHTSINAALGGLAPKLLL